jgi:hypothetical protein
VTDDQAATEKPSKVKLAEALAEVPGMPPAMLARAAGGYYHDYESPLAMPEVQLVRDLRDMAELPATGPKARAALRAIAHRVMEGDFDATKAESDAWAASAEGQEVMREFMSGIGKKRRRG